MLAIVQLDCFVLTVRKIGEESIKMKTSILVVALCLLSTVAHSADSYKWREFAEEGLTNKRTAEEQLYADKKYKREVIVNPWLWNVPCVRA